MPSFPRGVTPLDHTADIGMTVEAESLTALFHAAAAGLMAFVLDVGDDVKPRSSPAPDFETVAIELTAGDAAMLLADWLRELLFLIESRGLCFHDATFERLEPDGLRARLLVRRCPSAVREIKGVTYHGLEVVARAGGWHARVIFDV